MKVKIKTLAWKQFSHSDWLVILTCSFSGVFVSNLWFLLIVRVMGGARHFHLGDHWRGQFCNKGAVNGLCRTFRK